MHVGFWQMGLRWGMSGFSAGGFTDLTGLWRWTGDQLTQTYQLAYTGIIQLVSNGIHCHLLAMTQKSSAILKPRRKRRKDEYGNEFFRAMSSINDCSVNDCLMNELCLMGTGHLFIIYRIFYLNSTNLCSGLFVEHQYKQS